MNSRQRRVARRALERKYGVKIPPGHFLRLTYRGMTMESHVWPGGGVAFPASIVFGIEVLPKSAARSS